MSRSVIVPNPKHLEGEKIKEGHMTVANFSRSIGLRGGGIYRELKRYGIRTKRVGKYRIISIEQADKYLSLTQKDHIPRVTKKPSGWLTAKQAAGIVGCNDTVIWKAANEGRIRAVRRGYTRYHEPSDVEALRLEWNHYPLPGWYAVREATSAENADRHTAIRWIESAGFETRKYRNPETKQITVYAVREALDAWLTHYRDYQNTPLADDEILEILGRFNKPMTTTEITKHSRFGRDAIALKARLMHRKGILNRSEGKPARWNLV